MLLCTHFEGAIHPSLFFLRLPICIFYLRTMPPICTGYECMRATRDANAKQSHIEDELKVKPIFREQWTLAARKKRNNPAGGKFSVPRVGFLLGKFHRKLLI